MRDAEPDSDPSRLALRARLLAAALAIALLGACAGLAMRSGPQANPGPPRAVADQAQPPPGGYFQLRRASAYASLPDDGGAAAEVHRSRWEPRPGNARYNHPVPPHLALRRADPAARAYSPPWNHYVLERITGHYSGTTDEIFQWAAAKWGLPDNLLRAIAYTESGWRQANRGDFTRDRADCPPGYHRLPCPVTFGIVGTKSTSWPGIFPWNRDSTAAAVDVLGGWLRGCYEGWVLWLRGSASQPASGYRRGDLWGCVGAWYSGRWHDGSPREAGTGENYIARVRHWYADEPWLRRGF